MKTDLFKLAPISEVDLTTLPNNEDYYCEVWVIDDETPIGQPTEKSPIILRFKNGIFIDERGTGWEPFEIASILLPISEKQIDERIEKLKIENTYLKERIINYEPWQEEDHY